jgi:hypothetical protein
MHNNQSCLWVWSSSSSLLRHLLCMDLLWESYCHLVLANHEQIRGHTFAYLAVLQAACLWGKNIDVCGGPVDRTSQIGFTFGQCSIMLLSYWDEFWDAHVIMQFVATLESFQIISWALHEGVVYDFSSNFRLFLCVLPIFLFSSILTNLPQTTNVAPTHAYIASLCLNIIWLLMWLNINVIPHKTTTWVLQSLQHCLNWHFGVRSFHAENSKKPKTNAMSHTQESHSQCYTKVMQ